MKALAVLTALGTFLVIPAASVATPAQAGATCQGRPATVVGDGAGIYLGTDGPDVMVVRGGFAEGLGGDDLICLIGARGATADAGPGDDVVDARGAGRAGVSLGAGADTFLGSPGDDSVDGADGVANPVDTERDVIATGAGEDVVYSGAPGVANPDRISTGRGADHLEMYGIDEHLAVGSGDNTLRVALTAASGEQWRFNVAHHIVSRNGVRSSWDGTITEFAFWAPEAQPDIRLQFFGSRGADSVSVSGSALVTSLHLRGGRDVADVRDATRAGTYAMGPGQDRLMVGSFDETTSSFAVDRLSVDLETHEVDFGGDGAEGTTYGAETLIGAASWLRLVGSERAEHIGANGCDVAIDGGPGADRLTRNSFGILNCSGPTSDRLVGGSGPDVLRGSDITDDVLLGGPGYDVARGGGGDDTCRAEVTKGCEQD